MDGIIDIFGKRNNSESFVFLVYTWKLLLYFVKKIGSIALIVF